MARKRVNPRKGGPSANSAARNSRRLVANGFVDPRKGIPQNRSRVHTRTLANGFSSAGRVRIRIDGKRYYKGGVAAAKAMAAFLAKRKQPKSKRDAKVNDELRARAVRMDSGNWDCHLRCVANGLKLLVDWDAVYASDPRRPLSASSTSAGASGGG